MTYGQHNYSVVYYNGNYPDKTDKGSFNKEYLFDVIGYYENCLVGDVIRFKINLPSDAKEHVFLNANGKKYTIAPNDYGEYLFNFQVSIFGQNNLTFTYEDDKYYKKVINIVFNSSAKIFVPDDFIYKGKDTISLTLPADAFGNLTVYESVYDDKSDDYVPGNVIISKTLNNGKVSINLANYLPLGYSSIFVKYEGNYFVQPVDEEVNILPKITFPDLLFKNNEYNIIIESPDNVVGNTTVIISYYNETERQWVDQLIIYNGSSKNYFNFNISKLNVGNYHIRVYVDDGYNGKQFKVTNNPPNSNITVDFPNIIKKYDDYVYYCINGFVKEMGGYATLYIDGKKIKKFDIYYNTLKQFINSNTLDLGNHTWLLAYSGDDYFKPCNVSGNFEVTWIVMPKQIIDNETIILNLNDKNATGVLRLLIDEKDYAIEFLDKWGEAKIDIKELSYGEHTYEISYSGDNKYPELIKKGKFNVVPEFYCVNLKANDEISAFFYPILIKLPEKATGTVNISIDGKTQKNNVVNGMCKFNLTNLTQGKHSFTAKYSGDNKFSSREISFNFTVNGYKIITETDNQGNTDCYVLILPNNATGNLTIYEIKYDKRQLQNVNIKLKSIEVNEGKAIIKVSDLNLNYGTHSIIVKYDGKDYSNVKSYSEKLKIMPKVIITEYLHVGDDGRIFIDLGNATGKINIRLNDADYSVVDLKNGKINVTIPSTNLFNENELEFSYIGSDVNKEVFGEYYDEYYEPHIYYIHVNIKNITIPIKLDSNETGNIMIDLPNNYQADVIIRVDGEKIVVTNITGGKVNIPISNLTIGTHNVNVEVKGVRGDVYQATGQLFVSKLNSTFNISTLYYDEGLQIKIKLSDGATGSLIIGIDNKYYYKVINNSQAILTMSNIQDGNYTVLVKYSGNDEYAQFIKSSKITIKNKKTDEILLILKKIKIKKSAKKIILSATLKVNSKPIKGLKVTFKFNKKTFISSTDSKGVAKVIIKKKFLKKLKVGKKIQYQVGYYGVLKKFSVKVKK